MIEAMYEDALTKVGVNGRERLSVLECGCIRALSSTHCYCLTLCIVLEALSRVFRELWN